MHVGLTLAQLDFTDVGPTPGSGRAPWAMVAAAAHRGEDLGFDSLWLTDQGRDPLVTLGALARITSRARLGAWFRTSLRPAAVLAKALSSIDVVSGGRLVVGLEPGEGGPDELAEACQVLVGMFGGGPFSFAGAHFRVAEARSLPLPVQRPHPPIWISGSDDGVLDVVARHADGWFAGWDPTPQDHRSRVAVLAAACDRIGRDPATVTMSLGLSALVVDDGRQAQTAEQVGGQLRAWEGPSVDAIVVGEVAKSLANPVTACNLEGLWASDPPNFSSSS